MFGIAAITLSRFCGDMSVGCLSSVCDIITNNPQLWDYIAISNHWQGLFNILIQIQMREKY